MPKMHAGHLDVYGIVTVGADLSASKYSLPRTIGSTGETMITVDGEVVFTNPAPYIDIRETSGGHKLWSDVEFIKEAIVDVSGTFDTFIELLDTPKPALSVDSHLGEIIIVNPDAIDNVQKIAYSGTKISDLYSVSGGPIYGDVTVNGILTLTPSSGITNSNPGAYGSESFGKDAMPANNGIFNTAIGFYSLNTNSTGTYNTGVGANTLSSNTVGNNNVAVGAAALTSNVTGSNNVAVGFESLVNLIDGSGNVAIGSNAGQSYNTISNRLFITNIDDGGNTNNNLIYGEFDTKKLNLNASVTTMGKFGYWNECFGDSSGQYLEVTYDNVILGQNAASNVGKNNNGLGNENVVIGNYALQLNEDSIQNVAIGTYASQNRKTGGGSVAIGYGSQQFAGNPSVYTPSGNINTSGVTTSAMVGYNSGQFNSGINNTGIGHGAHRFNLGSNNTALGRAALFGLSSSNYPIGSNGGWNTAVGSYSMRFAHTGTNNTAVGAFSLQGNNVMIGNNNTAIGDYALYNNISGSNNVAIGHNAGINETGSNKLYITNSATTSGNTLIYGDFSTGDLYTNGSKILNSSNYQNIISNAVNPLDMGYDIVLCCGQSNMTGRGVYDNLVDVTNEKVFQFGGSASSDPRYSTIYLAQDSLSHAQSISASYFSGVWHIGPSMYFARNYVNIVPPNRRVLLVPCAWGATSMVSGAWSPFGGAPTGSLTPNITSGSMLVPGALYENAISQANKAIAAAKVEYPHSRFVGTIWLQGENDGAAAVSQNTYAAHLDGLINGFRSRINGASNSWFVVGEMLPEGIANNANFVPVDNAHIYTLTRDNLTGLALNISGQSNGDNLHYNATGLHIMGIRMAEQVEAAKYNVAGTKPVPVNNGPYISTYGTGKVKVEWDAPLCRATDYNIVYRTSPSGSWTTTTMGSPYRRKIITGLTPSVVYDFAIYTKNELGTSSISPITTFTVV